MEILEKDSEGFPTKMYSLMNMGIMTDRESLMSLDMKKQSDGKYLWICQSYEDPAFPITKKAIRIDLFKAVMFWGEGNDSRAIEFSYFNMGGYFPMRLLNMALGSIVKKAIKD